ncbi:hypothetical protein D3C78_1236750 [compost metagenome]
MLAATAGTGQFVLGQVMDDFDARQVSGQRLAFATAFRRADNVLFGVVGGGCSNTFCFVKQHQLWCRRISTLLRLAPEQTLTKQRVLFFENSDLGLHISKQLLERSRVIRQLIGHGNHAADYTCQATNLGVKT